MTTRTNPESVRVEQEQRQSSALPKLRRAALAFAFVLAALALLLGEWTVCPFAILTQQPCPGCGLTRATLALLTGHFTEALRFHPASPVVIPLLGLLVFEATARYVLGRQPRWGAALQRAARLDATWPWAVLAALVIGVWLLRFAGLFGGPVRVDSPLY